MSIARVVLILTCPHASVSNTYIIVKLYLFSPASYANNADGDAGRNGGAEAQRYEGSLMNPTSFFGEDLPVGIPLIKSLSWLLCDRARTYLFLNAFTYIVP